MENLKHTKEYAEKLGLQVYPVIEGFENISKDIIQEKRRDGFVIGYMKAIEETAAPDLLEALIEVKKHMTAHIPERVFDIVNNAINKATK